jgi:hypothetical protein
MQKITAKEHLMKGEEFGETIVRGFVFFFFLSFLFFVDGGWNPPNASSMPIYTKLPVYFLKSTFIFVLLLLGVSFKLN